MHYLCLTLCVTETKQAEHSFFLQIGPCPNVRNLLYGWKLRRFRVDEQNLDVLCIMAVHTRLSFYYWMDCTGKKLALVCVINRDCPELSCTKKIFQNRLFHEIDLICNPRCSIVNYMQGNTTHIAQGFLGNIAKLILLKIDILVEAQQRRGSSLWCSISTIKLCVQSLSFYLQH